MKKVFAYDLLRVLFWVLACLVLNAPTAAAQPRQEPGDISFSFSAAPILQSKTGLDRGGEFSLRHYQLRGSATRSVAPAAQVGISVGYDYFDFHFSETAAFAGAEPWGDIHRIGFALPVFYRTRNNWQIFISPSIDWAGESGADLGKALRYGAALSAAYRFSPGFSLGAGFGIFQGLEETQFFPYLTLYWKISDRWLLTNPFSAGPIGPAGLELVYFSGTLWEIGGGGAYRSNRFRLDDEGVAPDGIGEQSGLPVWMRITRKFGRHYKLDVYGGALLNGELRLEDQDGRKLAADEFDPAAFLAINFAAKF